MTDEFVKLLDQGCADLGIELSDQQKEQFFKYYEMLIEKNKVMNLTAITELSDVITKHFVDSLLLVFRTVFFFTLTERTFPVLSLSLPVITFTRSPFLILCTADTSYSTSGARETIFINCFSRSSLATGPKIRVPLGFLSSLMITAAFSSNLM